MRGKNAAGPVWNLKPRQADAALGSLQSRTMSVRILFALVAVAFVGQAVTRPVRRTLNFNMFVLKPHQGTTDSPDRSILATNGLSRFGPLIEYLVQRVQGMMSVRLPPKEGTTLPFEMRVPVADSAENEIDVSESKIPGVVVRPSRTKPGTYELEIDVVVDDGQPEDKKQ